MRKIFDYLVYWIKERKQNITIALEKMLAWIVWAFPREILLLMHVNNKGTYQPAYPQSDQHLYDLFSGK